MFGFSFDKPRVKPMTDVFRAGNLSHMRRNSPPIRVLIVDDEPLIRWSMSETLLDHGCSVSEAGDGRGALDAVATGSAPYDVILLDFRLPDSNDLTLLARLRSRAPEAQVILMTAFGTPDVRQHAMELGAYTVIGKPFEVQELADLVHMAAESRS